MIAIVFLLISCTVASYTEYVNQLSNGRSYVWLTSMKGRNSNTCYVFGPKVQAFLSKAATDPGSIKQICFQSHLGIFMIDLNEKQAFHISDPRTSLEKESIGFDVAVSRLTSNDIQLLNRVKAQDKSFGCVHEPEMLISDDGFSREHMMDGFYNIDFGTILGDTDNVRNVDISQTFECEQPLVGLQKLVNPYWQPSDPVCAINIEKLESALSSLYGSIQITKHESEKSDNEFPIFSVTATKNHPDLKQAIISTFYQQVAKMKPNEFDDIDSPQYFWHGSSDTLTIDDINNFTLNSEKNLYSVIVTKYDLNSIDITLSYSGNKGSIFVFKATKNKPITKQVVLNQHYNQPTRAFTFNNDRINGFKLDETNDKYPAQWIFPFEAATQDYGLQIAAVFKMDLTLTSTDIRFISTLHDFNGWKNDNLELKKLLQH